MAVKDGKDMIFDLTDLIKLRDVVNWFFDTYYDESTQTMGEPWYGIDVHEPFDKVMYEIWDNVEIKIAEQMAEIIEYPALLTNSRLTLVDGEIKEDLDGEQYD